MVPSLLMLPTVFNLHDNDRLTAWKQFRDSLETSNTPFDDVADLWRSAPFVSHYLDHQNPAEWPDPWTLIVEGCFDELAIVIGMLYTIKLTQRFMNSQIEIHKATSPKEKEPVYMLIVDNEYVINYEYRTVSSVSVLEKIQTSLIWSK
jgi:hypothetical protein